MKRILATVLLSVAATGAALASDLPPPSAPPPRAPVVYAPPPPVYNWTGFYLGINGGWGFGKSDWNTTVAGTALDTGNFNVNGGLVGGTIGATGRATGLSPASKAISTAPGWMARPAPVAVPSCETKNNWLATIRGRIGYAADRVLFYRDRWRAFGDIVVNTTANWQSADKTGWTAGAGIEGAFTDHWTARVKYLFVDLQNASFTPVDAATPLRSNSMPT